MNNGAGIDNFNNFQKKPEPNYDLENAVDSRRLIKCPTKENLDNEESKKRSPSQENIANTVDSKRLIKCPTKDKL